MKHWLTFALVTTLFWGTTPILDRLAMGRAQPMAAVAVRGVVVGLVSVLIVAATGKMGDLAALDRRTVLLLAAGGLLAALVGQFTYFRALKMGPASAVVPIVACYPLVTVMLGILVLREPLTLSRAGGALLIVLGILLVK